jgi:hypothetical protein
MEATAREVSEPTTAWRFRSALLDFFFFSVRHRAYVV